MATYEQGYYVKVEFPDEATGIADWMWVRVESLWKNKLFIGRLDNEPLNHYDGKGGSGIATGSQLRPDSRASQDNRVYEAVSFRTRANPDASKNPSNDRAIWSLVEMLTNV